MFNNCYAYDRKTDRQTVTKSALFNNFTIATRHRLFM